MAEFVTAGSSIDVMVNEWDTGSKLSSSLTAAGASRKLGCSDTVTRTGLSVNGRSLKGG